MQNIDSGHLSKKIAGNNTKAINEISFYAVLGWAVGDAQ